MNAANTVVEATDASLSNKSLISKELWGRMTRRISKDENIDLHLAERILDQALGFLRLCAESDGTESYSPSPLVDIGWHTFILYTKPYADFCQDVAGRFLHHSPSDVEGVVYGTDNISRTVEALRTAGIAVDEPLWASTGDCSNYCSEGNCDNHA